MRHSAPLLEQDATSTFGRKTVVSISWFGAFAQQPLTAEFRTASDFRNGIPPIACYKDFTQS